MANRKNCSLRSVFLRWDSPNFYRYGSRTTAAHIALDLTVGSIKRTYAAQTDTRFGLDFEHGLGDYAHRVSSR